MPQDPRLGGTGVCCLVAQPLPPVPWVHPQLCLRPLLLSRTLRLAPLDLCCERDFHGLCSRRLHVIHDFTWSSLFPSLGAPGSLPLIDEKWGSGRDPQQGLCQLSAGKGRAGPRARARFYPVRDNAATPQPQAQGTAWRWLWWDWAPEAAALTPTSCVVLPLLASRPPL